MYPAPKYSRSSAWYECIISCCAALVFFWVEDLVLLMGAIRLKVPSPVLSCSLRVFVAKHRKLIRTKSNLLNLRKKSHFYRSVFCDSGATAPSSSKSSSSGQFFCYAGLCRVDDVCDLRLLASLMYNCLISCWKRIATDSRISGPSENFRGLKSVSFALFNTSISCGLFEEGIFPAVLAKSLQSLENFPSNWIYFRTPYLARWSMGLLVYFA